jgi:hypothetical protein
MEIENSKTCMHGSALSWLARVVEELLLPAWRVASGEDGEEGGRQGARRGGWPAGRTARRAACGDGVYADGVACGDNV